jgi:DNA mismatch repair protein MutS2
LKQADRQSLVILDELGAGTDPQEGAALARAIMTHLLERGITTLVTTHHPELKAFAHATPGVVNASVEFNLETLQPTFHLTIGLPGRSNALAIAKRLGLWDTIIDMARAELNPQDLRAEDLLEEIHRQRDLARQARSAAEKARKEVDSLRSELEKRLEKIEDERRIVLQKTQAEAEDQVRGLQSEIHTLRRIMERARQPLETLEQVEEQAQSLEETIVKPIERRVSPIGDRSLHRPARLGDKVRLRSLNTQGVVTTIGEEEAEVQVGMLRVRAHLSDLVPLSGEVEVEEQPSDEKRIAGKKDAPPTQGQAPEDFLPASPGMELDLRGQRADEALAVLDRYLDAAFLAGMPFARIIHGKGTGKLRQAVREALSQNSHIRSFEAGGDKEGGEGVTVVKFHPR